ncbi:CLASP family microtubule-associated protein [Schizosaccharomyces japonicus yFS275]|uniref:CLASP family microtubule-associated protein n=1 Tax=Schizosaccharomyces japonicus (strain yFS275 / FY16936) TaxID=402676 RepID=B6K7W7_SCHJY|nr:CLASP family microtubule-associated protein [Schizosaccharomyces japonicus yFS275]EEB09621.1 CLASP family microtubule-associated protein [Schizosaccharomyces japonicus yFS275]
MAENAVLHLIQLFKNNAAAEARIQGLDALRSYLNKNNISSDQIGVYINCFQLALETVNPLLLRSAFACYETFLKRLRAQFPNWVKHHVSQLKTLALDHIASKDLRRRVLNVLLELWHMNHTDVEQSMHQILTTNKNPDSRLHCLHWFTLAQKSGLNVDLKTLRPALIRNLSHADPHLREESKNVLISYYKGTTKQTRALLQRDLLDHNVQKDLVSSIATELGLDLASGSNNQNGINDTPTMKVLLHTYPTAELEKLEPLGTNFSRQLDQDFSPYYSVFEGKETEQNWSIRQEMITKLRRYLRGNALDDFHSELLSVVRNLRNGIVVGLSSLRTTLSYTSAQLLKELAILLKTEIDSMVDIFLPNLLKACALTKKVISHAANVTFATMIAHCGSPQRNFIFIMQASQDKNAQLRIFSANWADLMLNLKKDVGLNLDPQLASKNYEKIVIKGLSDSNSQVRELYRKLFWKVVDAFPSTQSTMEDNLSPTILKQLEALNSRKLPLSSSYPNTYKRGNLRPISLLKSSAVREPLLKSKKEEHPSYATANQNGIRKLGLPQRSASNPEKKRSTSKVPAITQLSSNFNHNSSERTVTFPSNGAQRVLSSGAVSGNPNGTRQKLLDLLGSDMDKKQYEGVKLLLSKFNRSQRSFSVEVPRKEYISPYLGKLLHNGTTLAYSLLFTPESLECLLLLLPAQTVMARLLLAVHDNTDLAHAFSAPCLPMLKEKLSKIHAFQDLYQLLMDISNMSAVPKLFPYKTDQKRIIIFGCLTWLREIFNEEVLLTKNPEFLKEVFTNVSVKNCAVSILPMVAKTKTTSRNWLPLSSLLKAFSDYDSTIYEAVRSQLDVTSSTKLLDSWNTNGGAECTDEPRSPSSSLKPISNTGASILSEEGQNATTDVASTEKQEFTKKEGLKPDLDVATNSEAMLSKSIKDAGLKSNGNANENTPVLSIQEKLDLTFNEFSASELQEVYNQDAELTMIAPNFRVEDIQKVNILHSPKTESVNFDDSDLDEIKSSDEGKDILPSLDNLLLPVDVDVAHTDLSNGEKKSEHKVTLSKQGSPALDSEDRISPIPSTPIPLDVDIAPNKWLKFRLDKMTTSTPLSKSCSEDLLYQLTVAFERKQAPSPLLRQVLKLVQKQPELTLNNINFASSLMNYLSDESVTANIADILLLLREYLLVASKQLHFDACSIVISSLLKRATISEDEDAVSIGIEDNVVIVGRIANPFKIIFFVRERILVKPSPSERHLVLLLQLLAEGVKRFDFFLYPECNTALQSIVSAFIEHPNPAVRKNVFQICIAMNTVTKSFDKTFEVLNTLTEGQRNLIIHFSSIV